ncbi:hypothetical protein [Deinococcus radiophilus]|uniref:hypothetical protein n=1 Tax=Deinococcus radiophilus TaxID=32062 RepID=UPI003613AF94
MQSKTYLTLAAALALGAASAQTGTAPASPVAGTTITNTATASYVDPASGTTLSSDSNTVQTVVLPQPSFDIVFTDTTPDGGTQNAVDTTTRVYTNATPGAVIETPYTIVNSGNVALNVAVTPATGSRLDNATIAYFYNTPGGTRTPVTGPVAVPVDDPATPEDEGQVRLIQVITVSATAPQGVSVGASPEGSVLGTGVQTDASGAYTGGNGVPTGQTLYEEQTVAGGAIVATPARGTDLQFVRVEVYTPVLVNSPETGSETNPPSTTTPPTVPGTTAPATNPNTGQPLVVELEGDEQRVRVPYSTTPGTAVFENVVTNNGALVDPVNLFPVNPDGTPWAYDPATGRFTSPDGDVTVRLLDPVTGAPLPTGSSGYPTLTVPADGGLPPTSPRSLTHPPPASALRCRW